MATNPFDRPEYEQAPAFSLTKSPIGSNFSTAVSTPATTTRTSLEKLYAANKAQGAKNQGKIARTGVDPRIVDFATGGLAMEVRGPEVALTAAQKFINAVKGAGKSRAALEESYTAERAARAFKGGAALSQGGESGAKAALGELKGALAPKPSFAPIRPLLSQGDVDELFTQVGNHPTLDFYEKITANNGLWKLFNGEVPPQSQLSLLEDVFGSDLVKAVQSQRSGWEKFKSLTTDILNIPRSLITSVDMSAPLRQGVLFTVTKPKQSIPAFGEMFKDFFSEANFNKWLADIPNNPRYAQMKDSGLYIANPNKLSGGLSAREESFMSNIAEKIPVVGGLVKASSRAYIGYLNKLRVDVFSNLAAKFEKDGVASADNLKSLANFVNSGTGRGDLGAFNRIAAELNAAFFSPRLIASRVNLLNPAWYFRQAPPVRKEAIKSFAEFVGIGSLVLGIAKGAGADVEIDPRSTDFGKIKVGNTRWDIWGGFQQWVRVFSQIASGEKKTTGGEVVPLSKEKYPFTSRFDVALQFGRGKLAPVPGLITELLDGQKLFGGDLNVPTEVAENMIPLYLQDMGDAINDLGPEALFTVGVPAFFGVGTQTYTPPKSAGNPFSR